MRSLFKSIRRDDLAGVETSLQKKPQQLNNHHQGRSPLQEAMEQNKTQIISLLLKKGAYYSSDDIPRYTYSTQIDVRFMLELDRLKRQVIFTFCCSQKKYGYLTSSVLAPMIDYLSRREKESASDVSGKVDAETRKNKYLNYLQEVVNFNNYRNMLLTRKGLDIRVICKFVQPSLIRLSVKSIASLEFLLGIKEKEEDNYQDRIIGIAHKIPDIIPDSLPHVAERISKPTIKYRMLHTDTGAAMCTTSVAFLASFGITGTTVAYLGLAGILVSWWAGIGLVLGITIAATLLTGLISYFAYRRPCEKQHTVSEAQFVNEQGSDEVHSFGR